MSLSSSRYEVGKYRELEVEVSTGELVGTPQTSAKAGLAKHQLDSPL